MAIKKNITIDGIEVPFKASAAVPCLYRIKFRRDIYKDFAALKDSVDESDEENSGLGMTMMDGRRRQHKLKWIDFVSSQIFLSVIVKILCSYHNIFIYDSYNKNRYMVLFYSFCIKVQC